MLLILVALGLLVFGVIRLGRELTPTQRVLLAVVCLLGLFWLILAALNAGLLGRATD